MPIANARLCSAAWEVVPAGELASLLLREGGVHSVPLSAYSKLSAKDLLSVFKSADLDTAMYMASRVSDSGFLDAVFKDRRKGVREALASNSHASAELRSKLVAVACAEGSSRHGEQLVKALLSSVDDSSAAWADLIVNPQLWQRLGAHPHSAAASRMIESLKRMKDLSSLLDTIDDEERASELAALAVVSVFYYVSAGSDTVSDAEMIRRLGMLPPSAPESFKQAVVYSTSLRIRRSTALRTADVVTRLFSQTRNPFLLREQLGAGISDGHVPTQMLLDSLDCGEITEGVVLSAAVSLAPWGIDAPLARLLMASPHALQRVRSVGPVSAEAVEYVAAAPEELDSMLGTIARTGVRTYSGEAPLVRGLLKAASDEQAALLLRALSSRSPLPQTVGLKSWTSFVWDSEDRDHAVRMLALLTDLVDELDPELTAQVAAQAASDGYVLSGELTIAVAHHLCAMLNSGQADPDLEPLAKALASASTLSPGSQWALVSAMDDFITRGPDANTQSPAYARALRAPAQLLLPLLPLFTDEDAALLLLKCCAILTPRETVRAVSAERLAVLVPKIPSSSLNIMRSDAFEQFEGTDAWRILVDSLPNCAEAIDELHAAPGLYRALVGRLLELQGEDMSSSRFSVALAMLPSWRGSLAEFSFMLSELE